jgi:hypothetical protein
METKDTKKVILIRTDLDLFRCNIGDDVEKDGRRGVYAGRECHPLCSCPGGGCSIEAPIILYRNDDRTIEREEVHQVAPSVERRLIVASISDRITTEDPRFERYNQLLSA